MVYKKIKLFLKIVASLKIIFIKIMFISFLFFNCESALSEVSNIEKNLAYKYCDAIEKNLFKGLDKERILKNEYFFDSINKNELNEEIAKLSNFSSEVDTICSYNLSIEELNDFRIMINLFLYKN